MAERSRNDAGEFIGIPSGLNRIKTRRVGPPDKAGSGAEDFDKFNESPSGGGVSSSGQKQKSFNKGHVKFASPKEAFRKGKKIARWFTSSILKDSDQAKGDFPPSTESNVPELKMPDKKDPRKKMPKMQKNLMRKQFSSEITSSERVPKCIKSFSHELGPKGGIQSVHPRAHSFNDLEELLRSLRSRFDAAKETVNLELGYFSREVMKISQKNDYLTSDKLRMAEELFVLAQRCIDMTSLEFRTKCEEIVHELTEKRQKCEVELLKVLFTRILFILTRCTRLLHFEKDNEPVNERSLDKFRECLERIPSVEMNWNVNKGSVDSGIGHLLCRTGDSKQKLKEKDQTRIRSWETESRSEVSVDKAELRTDYTDVNQKTPANWQCNLLSDVEQFHKIDGKCHMELINMEQDSCSDDSNLVICRICEELVPAIHLEPHSYICACADKCVSKNLDVDARLLKLAELLEHLLESRNSRNHETNDTPNSLRARTTDAAVTSEGHSPKFSEWRSKGMDGMLEDLHEMDTACIEDSHLALINLKSHLATKLNQCGPPSSNGSMTPASSTNSPQAGNLDFFWLDNNNQSEQEDKQQMIDLADIAHRVAGTDLSEEGSKFLLAYLQDLQDIFQRSKHKALIVDTFGSRIENLLREKYVLACDLVDITNDTGHPEIFKPWLDSASQSSTTSTPSHPSHKDRTSIDDFDIIKPISSGAYGKVFLARKRTTGDFFAIKVLKKLDMLWKNDIDRILAERNILITVRNPFVVRFFYSFTSRDNLYLVMEYLNGGDLYSLLQKVGCLEESVARSYIAELVLALEYLHSLGIVHRDLKPDNILIAQDGHIKLTDFGLSKIGLMNCTSDLSGTETEKFDVVDGPDQLNDDSEDNHRSAVGTPDYLAPEILLGTEHGCAADWWSVGIILFELITGIPPFTSENPEIIFDNILNRKIPWPSIPSEMSYEAQDLIDRFLVHDPNQRLGAKGASEVKSHPFFTGVDWSNLALQKAAFVPQPDSADDTSYFVSRYNSIGIQDDESSASDSSDLQSNSGLEKLADECGDLADFDSSPLDLSLINFSFKNLSQLASINQDVLLQSGKDSSSPCKGRQITDSRNFDAALKKSICNLGGT